VVGDRVEQLRARATGKDALELVDLEAVGVHRHGHDLRLEAAEGLQRAKVGRRLHGDRVTPVEEGLGEQLQALDAAARDQQLVFVRAAALNLLEPPGDGVERAGQAARRRVLERRRLAGLRELREQRGSPLAREGLRIRKAAGEGDQVGAAEKAQHEGDSVAHVAARAGCKELLPVTELGRDGHVRIVSDTPGGSSVVVHTSV
jgi:hypothetical protein